MPKKGKKYKGGTLIRKKLVGYAAGGKIGLKPTNATRTTARGSGAATRGTNFWA